MTDFLREAFGRAAAYKNSIIDKIDYACLYVGYLTWRVMNDESLFAVSPAVVDSPVLKRAISGYDGIKNQMQTSLSENLFKTTRTGDYAPKPDIKPTALNMLGQISNILPRLNWGSPLVLGCTMATLAICAYALQAGGGHALQDSIATIYGSSPDGLKRSQDTSELKP